MSLIPFLNPHPRGDLSAYIDGQLASRRAARVEMHIAACESCRAETEALRRTSAALESLPEVTAPRSFAVTPQMVARPVPALARPAPQPMAYGLRIASAGLAVALAAVVLVDSGGISTDDSGTRSGDDSGDTFLDSAGMTIAADGDLESEYDSNAQGGDDSEKSIEASGSTPMPLQPVAPDEGSGSGTGGVGIGLPATGEQSTEEPPAGNAADSTGVPTDGGALDAFTTAPEPAGADDGETSDLDNRDDESTQQAVPLEFLDVSSDGAGADDGFDLVVALEIALIAAIALALVASFVMPRLARRN